MGEPFRQFWVQKQSSARPNEAQAHDEEQPARSFVYVSDFMGILASDFRGADGIIPSV
jgi:hypothetical protein